MMAELDIWGFMLLAFSLGMMHALDADHIMAVTGLYGAPGKKNAIKLCLNWAMGHGVVLLLAAVATFFLGVIIPSAFSVIADYMVGVLLVIIGVVIVTGVIESKAHLHFHQHGGLPDHAHWHKHSSSAPHRHNKKHEHDHRALFVGAVHGAAGTAPLLALIPVAQSHWWSISYIMIFVGGMFLAMLIFGGVLGFAMRRLVSYGGYFDRLIRLFAAIGSLMMGLFMLRGLVGVVA